MGKVISGHTWNHQNYFLLCGMVPPNTHSLAPGELSSWSLVTSHTHTHPHTSPGPTFTWCPQAIFPERLFIEPHHQGQLSLGAPYVNFPFRGLAWGSRYLTLRVTREPPNSCPNFVPVSWVIVTLHDIKISYDDDSFTLSHNLDDVAKAIDCW